MPNYSHAYIGIIEDTEVYTICDDKHRENIEKDFNVTEGGVSVRFIPLPLVDAAPELLDALREIVAEIQHWRETGKPSLRVLMETQGRALAAIAKAEGR